MNGEMNAARTFRDLRVYQLARAASLEIFEASKTFPREEKFSLTDQAPLFFVSKASRFTLFVSTASRFAFSVNEPSSIWLFQYKGNLVRQAYGG